MDVDGRRRCAGVNAIPVFRSGDAVPDTGGGQAVVPASMVSTVPVMAAAPSPSR